MLHTKIQPSPIGALRLVSNGDALTELWLPGSFGPEPEGESDWLLDAASRELHAYFDGTLRDFDVPLAPRGTTFQLRVWNALRRIPYGRTMSYGEIAALIDAPGKARAVGAA